MISLPEKFPNRFVLVVQLKNYMSIVIVARRVMMTIAMIAKAPGIAAPISCPKFPRIPHPIDKDSAPNIHISQGICVRDEISSIL